MELSTLIGKQILSPAGAKLGYAKSAYMTRDLKKLCSLACIDAEEEEFYLPARAVLAADDVIIAGNARLAAPKGIPFPAGIPAYSHAGELLGCVSDLVCEPESSSRFAVTKDGERKLYPSDCVTLGETLIVYPTPAERRPAKAKPAASPRPVRTQAKNKTPAVEAARAQTPQAALPDPAETPSRPAAEYTFNRFNLLGRRVKRSVFGRSGQPVARAGDRVTAAVLALARRENCLLQLTVNTLTTVV